MTTTTAAPSPRTVRVADDLWVPFVALTALAEHAGASVVIRRFISEYIAEYGVFWAPEHKDIDPAEKPTAWYDCIECDMPHRLSGLNTPWGCSVTKARDDRRERAGAA